MLDYLGLRFKTMLRTVRSLLRQAKKDLIEASKIHEELDKRGLARLHDDESRRREDLLVKDFEHFVEELDKALKQVSVTERDDFVAEDRAFHELETLEYWFEGVEKKLHEVQQRFPQYAPTMEKLRGVFHDLDAHVRDLAGKEWAELKNQYFIIEHERQGSGDIWQLQTWHLAPLLESMRQLWKLRGEYNREQHLQGEMIKDDQRIVYLVDHLLNEHEAREQEKTVAEIVKLEHEIEKSFKEFSQNVERMEIAFTLIMKACVRVFYDLKEDERHAVALLDRFVAEGLGPVDVQTLRDGVKRGDVKIDALLESLQNAVRRGRHQVSAAR